MLGSPNGGHLLLGSLKSGSMNRDQGLEQSSDAAPLFGCLLKALLQPGWSHLKDLRCPRLLMADIEGCKGAT